MVVADDKGFSFVQHLYEQRILDVILPESISRSTAVCFPAGSLNGADVLMFVKLCLWDCLRLTAVLMSCV